MFNLKENEQIILLQLGSRLRAARLGRNESQQLFAERLGIARQTYSKMEQGQAAVPIGYWLRASALLDRLATWEGVIQEPLDLFEEYEQQQKVKKRAGGKHRKSGP